jgi:TonB family protein
MTMALRAANLPTYTGPKVLRIGVIQNNKVVEERIIRKRESVSVGTSEKNHFVIPAPSLPSKYDLFELRGTDYYLALTDDMDGRVSTATGVQDFKTLRASPNAQRKGSTVSVKLTDSSRGKVVIGEATLLFQFVVPPPIQPRPQLPAAARGGWIKSVDWLFAAFVMFSFIAHFGFVIYLQNQDWPMTQSWEAVPDRFAEFIMQAPPPTPQPVVDNNPSTTTEEPTVEAPSKAPSKQQAPSKTPAKVPTAEERAAAEAERRARLAEQLARLGINQVIGSLTGESGAAADALRGGGVSTNLDEVLGQVRGVGNATGEGGVLRGQRGGGGQGEVQGLSGLRASAGEAGQVQTGERGEERTVAGRARSGGGSEVGGTGSLDSGAVRMVVNRAMGGIKRCYESQLRRNPTLRGRVTVTFTVAGSGTVSSASASEAFNPDVGSCVVAVVRRLRFPAPEGGSVTYAFPFIFEPAN